MKKGIFFFMCMFILSGCFANSSDTNKDERNNSEDEIVYGLVGPGPINYGAINDNENTFDEATNPNPNAQMLEIHRQNLGDDEERVREILADEGVEAKGIFIIGKDIWVNASLDIEDNNVRKKRHEQLQKLLTNVLTSYDVHLRLN